MINDEKALKPFQKGDIFVYCTLVILTVILFFVVMSIGKTERSGFEISVSNERVLSYDFSTDKIEIYSVKNVTVEKIDENCYKISSAKGFNVIKIDAINNDVSVVDTDCGISKECTLMSLDDGVIICAPHELTIRPLDGSYVPKIG